MELILGFVLQGDGFVLQGERKKSEINLVFHQILKVVRNSRNSSKCLYGSSLLKPWEDGGMEMMSGLISKAAFSPVGSVIVMHDGLA